MALKERGTTIVTTHQYDSSPTWDIFCEVVDNYGDVGVCLRLARELAQRGQHVRLWLNDDTLLMWMKESTPSDRLHIFSYADIKNKLPKLNPSHYWIEAFGCDIPMCFVEYHAQHHTWPIHWFNLEYLSAESYVERSHLLPSPILSGPAAGQSKIFFYPGFTEKTGGLLPSTCHLENRPASITEKMQLRKQLGLISAQGLVVLLFCYEAPRILSLLTQLKASSASACITLLVTPGRASEAIQGMIFPNWVHIIALPQLTQPDFDALLCCTDFNFVRGEDSFAQALQVGTPTLWQIYPQTDEAHRIKLHAFLTLFHAHKNIQHWHDAWNGKEPYPKVLHWQAWQENAHSIARQLRQQTDLVTQLLGCSKLQCNQ